MVLVQKNYRYLDQKYTAAHTLPEAQRNYRQDAFSKSRPVMLGYQAAGSAPFIRGKKVTNPETVATAIRIGDPQSWDPAWSVQKESGGWFAGFADEEILATQALLARQDGIFCEPASATSVCGALADLRSGKIPQGSTIVCTLTGHGLKDPDTAVRGGLQNVVQVPAALEAVEKVLRAAL